MPCIVYLIICSLFFSLLFPYILVSLVPDLLVVFPHGRGYSLSHLFLYLSTRYIQQTQTLHGTRYEPSSRSPRSKYL
ncbi:hypothetical protein F4678DRAFT_453979 [Xylaria arbuscula]|nr:hypothetical protein F4678DRAFT_453979 [Xylaria arbuscula]